MQRSSTTAATHATAAGSHSKWRPTWHQQHERLQQGRATVDRQWQWLLYCLQYHTLQSCCCLLCHLIVTMVVNVVLQQLVPYRLVIRFLHEYHSTQSSNDVGHGRYMRSRGRATQQCCCSKEETKGKPSCCRHLYMALCADAIALPTATMSMPCRTAA